MSLRTYGVGPPEIALEIMEGASVVETEGALPSKEY